MENTNSSIGGSILILSPFFFPEEISTGRYNTKLAEKLAVTGMRVSVITSHPLYPAWRPRATRAALDNIDVIRGGSWMYYPRIAFLRRAVLEVWYSLHVIVSCLSLKEKPGCVVSIFPPSLFFYLLNIILVQRCQRIGIVHDLQGVYIDRSKGFVARIIGAVAHFIEKRCFKSCDRLTFLSSSMKKKAISEYGLDQSKCTVCYPFSSLAENTDVHACVLSSLFDDTRINLVYSGALGDKQNPDGLFNFMCELSKAMPDVCCHIFSAGPHFDGLRATQEDGVDSSVVFHDLVAEENLVELYARSDIQIISQEFGTSEGSLPSKLPNIMAAGVPVFIVCDPESELGALVVEMDVGYVANTWDTAELVDLFVENIPVLLSEPRAERVERLRTIVDKKFSIDCVIDHIIRPQSSGETV